MKKLSKEAAEVIHRVKRRVESIECDHCKRIITPVYNEHGRYDDDKSRYFSVTTGHNDGSNDSCESIEHFDICPNCIGDFVANHLLTTGGTAYVEVETEYIHKDSYEYDY